MLLHQLLNVDQVSGYLSHRLGQVRIINQVECLFGQIADVVPSEAAVDHVAVLVHHGHVLLDVVRACPQSGHIRLQIDWESLLCFVTCIFRLLFFCLGACLFLFELAAGHLGKRDEGDWSTCFNWLIFFVGRFGDQF